MAECCLIFVEFLRLFLTRRQDASTPSWANVRIKSPSTTRESGYREDICDFWDSTGYYVNFSSSVVDTTVETLSTTSSAGSISSMQLMIAVTLIKILVIFQQTS